MYLFLFYQLYVAALMRKHHRIILNYYLKYMSGFDAQMLRNVVMVSRILLYCEMYFSFCSLQAIQVCPEEESLLMTSFVDTLAHLQGREGKEACEFDFQVSSENRIMGSHCCFGMIILASLQALRLDWFRLQALTSVSRAALSLRDKENADLAPAMNAVVVHSKLVDNFEELLIEQADMSFFW